MRNWIAVFIMVLACCTSASAQTPVVTANAVVDAASLEAFVEGVVTRLQELNAAGEQRSPFLASLRKEGDWKHGNTYIILIDTDGRVVHHSNDESAESKRLLDLEDARGNMFWESIWAVMNQDSQGGHVEYYWDDPAQEGDEETAKMAYVTYFRGVEYAPPIIVLGGFYMDLSHVPDIVVDHSLVPAPEVTAADVKDRATLQAFVRSAEGSFLSALQEHGEERIPELVDVFRAKDGDWRHGSIYPFILDFNGYVLFHGVRPALEDQVYLNVEDVNGVKIVREMIEIARAGGGYLEYYYDDPAVEGDEDTGSPKVSYVEEAVIEFSGISVIIGAGFYLGSPTATTPSSWGQIKSSK